MRYQKEYVVTQRFAATGRCPTLKDAGGMGVRGVIRNGKWGHLEGAAPTQEMALGIWKRVRDPGFSPVSALQQPDPMWKLFGKRVWRCRFF